MAAGSKIDVTLISRFIVDLRKLLAERFPQPVPSLPSFSDRIACH